MWKRYHEVISHLTIWACTICYIICSVFLHIKPEWLNIILSFIISLVTSYSVVYFLIGFIFRFVYKRREKEFYLGGTWYVVYYSDYYKDKYLRLGKLEIRQDYEQISLENLTSHTPKIQNDNVIPERFRDDEESETPSTGHGFAKIDRKNRTLAGIYYITRSAQQTAVGMLHCQINDTNQELYGEFTTTESARPNNRPVGGKLRFFRDENSQLRFCNNLIQTKKEQ